MKKTIRIIFLSILVLLVCTLTFTACDSGDDTQAPGEATDDSTLTDTEAVPEDDSSTEESGDSTAEDNTESHVHSFGEWTIIKDSTCVENGEQERVCACGEKESKAVDLLAHTEEIDPAVAPTCTASGLSEGSHCSICDKVLVAQESLPATDHFWNDATCTMPAGCAVCDAVKGHPNGHTTDNGFCETCDEFYMSPYQLELAKEDLRYQEDLDSLISAEASIQARQELLQSRMELHQIPALASPSYYASQLSSISTQVESKMQKLYSPSTSAAEKITLQNEIDQLNEKYNYYYACQEIALEWEELDYDITLIENERKAFTAQHLHNVSVIQEEFSSEYAIAQEVHISMTWVVEKEPTCTQDGKRYYKCDYCEYTLPQIMPALGHSILDATCTTAEHCDRCDEVFSPALDHDWVDASCTTPKYCGRCEESEGNALGHTLVEHEALSPSCANVGHNAYVVCSRCDYSTYEEIAKLAHDCPDGWTVIKDPGYYEEGVQVGVCTSCGEVEGIIPRLPCSQGLRFTDNYDGTYSWTGMGTCTDTCIVIPDTYNGLPVSRLESPGDGVSFVTEVVVPPSVTYITPGTFLFFDNLEKITLPYIGTTRSYGRFFTSIFGGDNYQVGNALVPETLKTVVITHETSVAEYAFYSCDSIEYIVLNEGVTDIGKCAFNYCESLKSISFPNSVQSIGSKALSSCKALEQVTFGSGVTHIPMECFMYCDNLSKVTMTNSVKEFSTGAFHTCTNLKEICFEGTAAQWSEIYKYPAMSYVGYTAAWDSHLPDNYVVYCSDANITQQ